MLSNKEDLAKISILTGRDRIYYSRAGPIFSYTVRSNSNTTRSLEIFNSYFSHFFQEIKNFEKIFEYFFF